MPAITVRITGLETALAQLAQLPGLIAEALQAGAKRIGDEGTKHWQSLVSVRTGRMRSALSVQVVAKAGTVHVYYFVGARGFYYGFQPQRAQWDASLAAFIAGRAPQIIDDELRRRIR